MILAVAWAQGAVTIAAVAAGWGACVVAEKLGFIKK